jgi:hypothetical protein
VYVALIVRDYVNENRTTLLLHLGDPRPGAAPQSVHPDWVTTIGKPADGDRGFASPHHGVGARTAFAHRGAHPDPQLRPVPIVLGAAI